MSDTLAATVKTVVTWNRSQSAALGSVQDKAIRTTTSSYMDGYGVGQAEQVFHDRRTLPAMTGETLDLLAMTKSSLNVGLVMEFATIRVLQVRNLSSVLWHGLNVGADIANPATHYALRVGSQSVATLENSREGWVLDEGSRYLAIANPNDEPVTYEIVVIGAPE